MTGMVSTVCVVRRRVLCSGPRLGAGAVMVIDLLADRGATAGGQPGGRRHRGWHRWRSRVGRRGSWLLFLVWTVRSSVRLPVRSVRYRLDEPLVQQPGQGRAVLHHTGAEDVVRGLRGLVVEVLRGGTGRE